MTTQGNHDDNDDILESNVSTLLETGGDAPRMTDIARARIRGKLIEDFGAKGGAATGARKRSPALAIGAGLAAVARRRSWRPSSGAAAAVATRARAATARSRSPTARPRSRRPARRSPSSARATCACPARCCSTWRRGKGTFTVDTAVGHVEVLGTRFVVDGEAARTTTAVVRGEVKLVNDRRRARPPRRRAGRRRARQALVRSAAPRLSHLVSWAEQTRRHLETTEPVHHGTLFARDAPAEPAVGARGVPLPIAKLGVDVVVEDQVARVAIDQTFHNDAPQDLEGMYRFAIPPDAALQRLAMYVDGKLERVGGRRAHAARAGSTRSWCTGASIPRCSSGRARASSSCACTRCRRSRTSGWCSRTRRACRSCTTTGR